MTTKNPYAPPESSVEIKVGTIRQEHPPFFTTSTRKFILMSIGTLGFYDFYWFYKNWVLIKQRTGQNIMPFWRTFFSIFWAYSCFKHIKTYATARNIDNSLPIVILAILYFIIQFIGQAPESVFDILAFFGILILIPVNSLALSINQENNPNFINNEKLVGLNWVAIIVGCPLFALLMLASVNPEFVAEML